MKILTSSFTLFALFFSLFILILACSNEKPETMKEEKNIGVQIYSVRNELNQNFDSTLAILSEIGFTNIEAYGLSLDGTLFGMSPSDYKKAVEDYGMKLVSSHSEYFTSDKAPIMIEAAKEAGLEYVVIPWIPNELRSDYEAIAENLNSIGAQFKEAGIGFGYHNHDFEFYPTEDGRIPLEILLDGTDPEYVDFQLDLFWVVHAKANPMEIINKYQGRFASFHIKDSDVDLNQTTVGTGIIDFKNILSNQETSGYKFYFVEDERTDDPFSNIKNAYNHLLTLDF